MNLLTSISAIFLLSGGLTHSAYGQQVFSDPSYSHDVRDTVVSASSDSEVRWQIFKVDLSQLTVDRKQFVQSNCLTQFKIRENLYLWHELPRAVFAPGELRDSQEIQKVGPLDALNYVTIEEVSFEGYENVFYRYETIQNGWVQNRKSFTIYIELLNYRDVKELRRIEGCSGLTYRLETVTF